MKLRAIVFITILVLFCKSSWSQKKIIIHNSFLRGYIIVANGDARIYFTKDTLIEASNVKGIINKMTELPQYKDPVDIKRMLANNGIDTLRSLDDPLQNVDNKLTFKKRRKTYYFIYFNQCMSKVDFFDGNVRKIFFTFMFLQGDDCDSR